MTHILEAIAPQFLICQPEKHSTISGQHMYFGYFTGACDRPGGYGLRH